MALIASAAASALAMTAASPGIVTVGPGAVTVTPGAVTVSPGRVTVRAGSWRFAIGLLAPTATQVKVSPVREVT